MKQGFQCEFCDEFSENSEAILTHEKECSFNPENKRCWTCKHRYQTGGDLFGIIEECKMQHDNFEIFENDLSCKFWEKMKGK